MVNQAIIIIIAYRPRRKIPGIGRYPMGPTTMLPGICKNAQKQDFCGNFSKTHKLQSFCRKFVNTRSIKEFKAFFAESLPNPATHYFFLRHLK